MIDKAGVYKISFDEYLADPCPKPSLTRSTIKDLLFRSPCHAYYGHPRLNPDYNKDEDSKFDIGTAAHSVFLQGIDIAIALDYDDWRKKEAQSAREEIRNMGKVPLLKHQYNDVITMVNSAHLHLLSSELELTIASGDTELSYIWQEKETWCRIRPDWISKDRTLILDYKTTGNSASPEDYNRIVVSTALDIQDAFYRRGVNAVEGTEPDFIFMVQEVEEPFLCSFIRLDLMFQDMGKEKVIRGLKLWRKCLEEDNWPGYSNKVYTLEPPGWAMAGWEMKKYE
jgi:hypothetical protein